MKSFLDKIIIFSLLTILSVGLVACHSSRKVIKEPSGTIIEKTDYKRMSEELKSRKYETPLIGTLIAEASRWLGVPYKYAGNDKDGVDCSGLTSQVFLKALNVKMPRSSREQQQWCKQLDKDNLQPGDLVFFATGSDRNRVSHVGLYIGDGEIIHASSSRGVIVSNLGETYYMMRYHSSGRPDAISKIYDDKSKNNKKKSNEIRIVEENKKLSLTPTTPSATNSIITIKEISVDQLIELQVDSIADALNNSPITQTPIITSSPNITKKEYEVPTTTPPILPELTDSITSQFFD